MKSNTEIELKLVISEENLQKFFALPLVEATLRSESKNVRQLSTSYYDTPDMVFHKHGIAYRVRDKGDGSFEATVKTRKGEINGVVERLELNIPLVEDRAVLTGFKAMGLDYELTDLAPQGVERLFTVNVERITYLIDYAGAVIELAIDKGYIIAGEARDKVDEIEFELKQGDVSALFEFAAKVKAVIPMRTEERTKYARGLALR